MEDAVRMVFFADRTPNPQAKASFMSAPRFSVVIPTYNRLAYLREALDSVARQSRQPFEVIVVDDGSDEDIAAGVADHQTHPQVFRQSQQGPAAARNVGAAAATGDWIAFLDSDDRWLPNKLETYAKRISADPNINILYGPMKPVDAIGKPVQGRTKPCHDGKITDPLFHSSFVHVPTVVMRRALFESAGGFNPQLPVCEDYDLWLRLSLTERFALIEEPLALRRLHGNRLSKQQMSRNLRVKADVLQRFFELTAARESLDRPRARVRLARVLFVAARECAHASEFDYAQRLLRASRTYGGSWLRAVGLTLSTSIRKRFSTNVDTTTQAPKAAQDLSPATSLDRPR